MGFHKPRKSLKVELSLEFPSLSCPYVTTFVAGTTSGRLHCPVKWPEDCHCLPLPSGNHFLKYEICLSGGNLSRCYLLSFVVIYEVFLCCKSQFVCDDVIFRGSRLINDKQLFKISIQTNSMALLLCRHVIFVDGERCFEFLKCNNYKNWSFELLWLQAVFYFLH